MAARGIKVNHNGDAGLSYVAYESADFLDLSTTSIVIALWVRVKGASSGSDSEGHDVVALPMGANFWSAGGIEICSGDANAASPWSFKGRCYSGSLEDTDMEVNTVDTDEDWFFALSYDTSTDQATWYSAIDGAGALTSHAGATGRTWSAPMDGIYIGGVPASGNHKGANVEITNVKFWVGRTMTSGELFSEMNSEAVVDNTSLYAHWKLPSSSDLTDSSGNGRSLTATGTVTSGTMDPVDIQGGGGGGSDVFFEGLQNLSNGFKAATAAGMQGVIVT